MRIYTVITQRNPALLTQFAQQAKALNATGVTLITHPPLVAATSPPLDQTEAYHLQLADAAAARKDYPAAAAHQINATRAKTAEANAAATGADWIKQATTPIKDITQLIVLGALHWPQQDEFTVRNFFRHLGPVSDALVTTGVGGIVQKTPLDQRVFIPLGQTTVATGHAALGEPVAGVDAGPVETSGRHPSIPATLPETFVAFVNKRLGLDQGGKVRSLNETANQMGLSIYNARKAETEVIKVWPEFEQKVAPTTTAAPEPVAA